jgi:DNA-binding transcriptional MerR regulator
MQASAVWGASSKNLKHPGRILYCAVGNGGPLKLEISMLETENQKFKFFTQKEVNRIFGHIPTRTLRWWGLMGLYQWGFDIPDGRGITRYYSLENLYQIGIVEELSSLNIPVAVIKQIMDSNFRVGETDIPDYPCHIFGLERNDILVISKSLIEPEEGKRERRSYKWSSMITYLYEILYNEDFISQTMILVCLKDIKKRVDSQVAEWEEAQKKA